MSLTFDTISKEDKLKALKYGFTFKAISYYKNIKFNYKNRYNWYSTGSLYFINILVMEVYIGNYNGDELIEFIKNEKI